MYACKHEKGPATWYSNAVLTRVLVVSCRIRSPSSTGQEVALGCVSHSLITCASPSPGIGVTSDPGETIKSPMRFLFLELHIDLRTSLVDSFRIAVEFSVNSAWRRCRIFLVTSARLGDSSRRSRRYGAGSPRLLIPAHCQWSVLLFVPLVPAQAGIAWDLGTDLKGFSIGQTHQSGAPATMGTTALVTQHIL